MFEGQSSHLPLKLNTSGVIPPIFASSLLLLPTTVANFNAGQGPEWFVTITTQLGHGRPLFLILYVALIVFFAFFYTAIVFNPTETADNLKKHGGFIPGIRPGERTAEYIDYVLSRITVVGAAYLAIVCLIPEILISYAAVPFYFGGTSLLIVVSVTMAQQANEPERELITAAERGELVVVRQLLASGARINARDQRGRSALLAATQRNRVDVARFLIQEGADVNAKDFIQDTPFLYAAAEGRIEILKLTLAAGADVRDTNRYRGTALIPAAHHGHLEAVKLLLATAIDKDHINNLGWTALLEAVILGDGGSVHTEIVRQLVAAGANVGIADRDGITALDHAKRRGYREMVAILSAATAR